MLHKHVIIILLLLIAAFTAWSQCPGPAQRQALINLQKSQVVNGTRAYQVPMTDTCGNQRYVTLNSIINIIIDTLDQDTALLYNWYTRDDTTTENSRTAYIKQNAYWLGLDVNGRIYMQMGDISVSVMDLTQEYAHLLHEDLAGQQLISANTTGIDLETTASSTRAVDIYTDTINWRGSFDQTKLLIHYLSLENCMYADSNTVVVLGQFSPFQSLQLDGTEKGFYYEPGDEGVMMINGNGTTGAISQQTLTESAVTSYAQSDAVNTSYATIETSAVLDQSIIKIEANHILSPFSDNGFRVIAGDPGDSENLIGAIQLARDTNVSASFYFGKSDIPSIFYEGSRAFGVRTWPEEIPFDWIQTYLPNDTTGIQVSLYNRKYYFPNDTPYVAAGDTSFMYWAGDGVTGGKHPGFIKLSDVRGGGGVTLFSNKGNSLSGDTVQIGRPLDYSAPQIATDINENAPRWVSAFIGNEIGALVLADANIVGAPVLLLAAEDSTDMKSVLDGTFTTGTYGYTAQNAGSTYILNTFVDGTYNLTNNGITVGTAQIQDVISESNSGSTYIQAAACDLEETRWLVTGNAPDAFGDTTSFFQAYQNSELTRDIHYSAFGEYNTSGTFVSSAFIGRAPTNAIEQRARSSRDAFGVQQFSPGNAYLFNWLKIDLYDTITTKDAIAFYNDRYRWQNAEPSPTVGDTSFHFWAGIGSGNTNPGFITLAQIQNGVPNWYNSDGTTTDNTRIADVTQKAIWRSDDVTADGIYPFVFELDNTGENEPEMMTWKFPTDSLNLYQSDVEITFHSNTSLLNRADGYYSEWADSINMALNGVTSLKIGRYNTITHFSNESAGGNNQAPILTTAITGAGQAELFLDGSSAVLRMPTNSISNFDVQVSAICTAAGNGVGITTGDAWSSWHVGGIKRIVNATSLVGTVQTTATAQADAGMSTSVVTIDADDTDESLRIRFTPPSTAGSTSTFKVIATISLTQTTY